MSCGDFEGFESQGRISIDEAKRGMCVVLARLNECDEQELKRVTVVTCTNGLKRTWDDGTKGERMVATRESRTQDTST